MSDQRFADRLKRIEKRHRGGPKADMLAGVGEVNQMRQAAVSEPFPGLTMLVAGLSGFAALNFGQQRVDLAELQRLMTAPEEVIALAQEAPLLAASGAWLALIALAFLLSLLLRGVSARWHAFGFVGVAGALCALSYAIADPEKVMALIETYLPMAQTALSPA